MCCGVRSIMFSIYLVEGSDRPKEIQKGPTVSLLLRMCKPLYTKRAIVILHSGLCVLKGIVDLMKKGVYVGAFTIYVDTGPSLSKKIPWIRE